MIIRKFKKKKKWNIFILIIVAIFVLVFLLKSDYKININIDSNISSGNDYTKLKGTLNISDELGYDGYFFESNNSKYSLKNYPKNIKNLLGKNIELVGEIKKYEGNQVFLIDSTKDLDDNVVIKDNIYMFMDDLLIINSKENPLIVPFKYGGKISVYYKGNYLLDISTFVCSKISSSRNCREIVNEFESNENEYFNSYNGIVYYKINSNKRELFNDFFMGYYLQTSEDNTLLNVSSIIDLIDGDYIINNQKNIILDYCGDLLDIENINIVGKNQKILNIVVIGKDKDKNKTECKLGFDLMDDREIVN